MGAFDRTWGSFDAPHKLEPTSKLPAPATGYLRCI